MGRPSDYSPAIAESVLLRMYEGESLRKICQDDSMPARSTVHMWRIRNEEFSSQYARARRAQVEARIEEANDIADDGSNDFVDTEEGGKQLNSEHIQRSKLRVEQRRWEASKLLRGPIDAPLDYGDKAEIGGPNGGAIPVKLTIEGLEIDL